MKKIMDAIKRNTMLKVFSLIIAILLWAFVQLAQNPEISYDVFEVPVTITGEAGINNEGFVISNPPANLSTNVTSSTKRSYLNSFDHSSLSASGGDYYYTFIFSSIMPAGVMSITPYSPFRAQPGFIT